ncbi:MAG TPA: hypothetical protein VFH73_29205 [Polyangia bacterium]|nr:hypothetical protein [Polyangia bacterium]
MDDSEQWLARLRHDLVKRLVWPARDRRDLGGPVARGELVATVIDDQGSPIAAALLWAKLRGHAPASVPERALDTFGAVISVAVTAAAADDIAGVLALEPAFEQLARLVKSQGV